MTRGEQNTQNVGAAVAWQSRRTPDSQFPRQTNSSPQPVFINCRHIGKHKPGLEQFSISRHGQNVTGALEKERQVTLHMEGVARKCLIWTDTSSRYMATALFDFIKTVDPVTAIVHSN